MKQEVYEDGRTNEGSPRRNRYILSSMASAAPISPSDFNLYGSSFSLLDGKHKCSCFFVLQSKESNIFEHFVYTMNKEREIHNKNKTNNQYTAAKKYSELMVNSYK